MQCCCLAEEYNINFTVQYLLFHVNIFANIFRENNAQNIQREGRWGPALSPFLTKRSSLPKNLGKMVQNFGLWSLPFEKGPVLFRSCPPPSVLFEKLATAW